MSRRMCCSRVCSASRYAGRPSASTETPTSRPGRCRSRPARDGHVAGVRAAVEQRDAEALGGADDHVGARARRATRAGSARAGRRRRRPARRARGPPRSAAAGRGSGRRRRGTAPARRTASPSGRPSARSATTTSMPIASARVRTTSIVCGSASASTTNGPVAFVFAAAHQRHRLGGGGALVEQRGVGGRQPGQVADHGLEVEQRLEPALGDLRLVRRVGGVPARVLEHVAPDHRRGDRAVVAQADHRLGGAVGGRRARAARAAASLSVSGVGQVERRAAARMPPGTAASIRASSESKPSALEHRGAIVVGTRPMWRSAKRTGLAMVGHGWLLDWIGQVRLPLCRAGRRRRSSRVA